MSGTIMVIILWALVASFIVLLILLIRKHLKTGHLKGILKDPMLLFLFGFLSLMGNSIIKASLVGDTAAIISHILIVLSIILNGCFIYAVSKQIREKRKK